MTYTNIFEEHQQEAFKQKRKESEDNSNHFLTEFFNELENEQSQKKIKLDFENEEENNGVHMPTELTESQITNETKMHSTNDMTSSNEFEVSISQNENEKEFQEYIDFSMNQGKFDNLANFALMASALIDDEPQSIAQAKKYLIGLNGKKLLMKNTSPYLVMELMK